jgi:hypothetical protein
VSKLVLCECGCGKEVYFNKLTLLEVEEAKDETRREVKQRRFFVTAECKEPFEQELVLEQLVQALVKAWVRAPASRGFLERLFFPWTFYVWIRRLFVAKKVMQMQHAIWERRKGFDYARKRAVRSAVLFGAPSVLRGWLFKRFSLSDAQVTLKPQ